MPSTNADDLRVRHVLASDQDPLRALRLASLSTNPEAFGGTYAQALTHPAEWWEHWASQSELGTTQRTFVLETSDGRWVGLALIRLDDERPESSTLNAMWVAPESRGKGAAQLLCEACANWAAEQGCAEVTLTVVVENHSARRAYEAAGFEVRGETTWDRDGEILDELVMTRSL